MRIFRTLAITLLLGEMAFAFQVPEDPVLKARTQRAQAQGISDGDLPPVPRAISEPPPLPAPETNYKDTRRGRVAHSSRSGRVRKGRRTTKQRIQKPKVHAAAKSVKKKHR